MSWRSYYVGNGREENRVGCGIGLLTSCLSWDRQNAGGEEKTLDRRVPVEDTDEYY